MARRAILTQSQCEKIRSQYQGGIRALNLAKRFAVSESTVYKVLDGSYHPRIEEPLNTKIERPMGITPSLFAETARGMQQELHPALKKLLKQAQVTDASELDDVTLAAAEFVVAKARLNRVLAQAH